LYYLFPIKSIQDYQGHFVYSHIDFTNIIDINFTLVMEVIITILESLLIKVRQNLVYFSFRIVVEPFISEMDSLRINYSHMCFKFHSLACQLNYYPYPSSRKHFTYRQEH